MADANDTTARDQRFRDAFQARTNDVSELSVADLEAAHARNAAFRAHAKRLLEHSDGGGGTRRFPRRPR
jgi:hypothetical protein